MKAWMFAAALTAALAAYGAGFVSGMAAEVFARPQVPPMSFCLKPEPCIEKLPFKKGLTADEVKRACGWVTS